jgi:hypothetical protein
MSRDTGLTATFEPGDIVTADGVFSGTVVRVPGDRVIVENRDGDREQFSHGDLKHTC